MVVLARDAVLAGILFAIWSLAVGFARVALGVHFLLDILAGYLLGLAVGLALWPWIVRGMPGSAAVSLVSRPETSCAPPPCGIRFHTREEPWTMLPGSESAATTNSPRASRAS